MKRLLATFGLVGVLAACAVPSPNIGQSSFKASSTPTTNECPTDGSTYGFGSCTPAPGVIPGPAGLVDPGAPTKTCVFRDERFECPASCTVPDEDSVRLGE